MGDRKTGELVSARGTVRGLSLCIQTGAPNDEILSSVRAFVASRIEFLRGNELCVEWRGEKREDLTRAVLHLLQIDFGIDADEEDAATEHQRPVSRKRLKLAVPSVSGTKDFEENSSMTREEEDLEAGGELGLFGGLSSLEDSGARASARSEASSAPRSGGASLLDSAALWDDPDARVVYETLRSGQRLESEHSIVVVGDVNSGAEVVSGGDVIVLGKLRGVAHAGAFEESGGRRFIFALDLDPTQLRIGSVISRGDESRLAGGRRVLRPEVARVDTDRIVVEEYSPRPRFVRSASNT